MKDVFFALYEQYNEEPALDNFPDGRAVYRGDTQDSVYAAALALDEYEWKRVSADSATVYIMRMPLDPDAGVLYDMTTETLFTLRYFAALQRYSDMINGDGGWLATATANWAEGFEDFRLTDG